MERGINVASHFMRVQKGTGSLIHQGAVCDGIEGWLSILSICMYQTSV